MKNNIIPSIIIAAAIVFSAIFSHWATKRSAENFVCSLKEALTKKEVSGKTQVEEMTESVVTSVVQGFKAGFSTIGGSDDSAKQEIKLPPESILIKDVTLVFTGHGNQERAIGVLKNTGSLVVKRVQANVVFRDAKGALIDVKSSERLLNDFNDVVLTPGQEIGFEIERSWGSFANEEDSSGAKKSADVQITITEVIGANNEDAEIKG